MSASQRTAALSRLLPWGLAAAVVLAYLPSLSGGFLNWDDPWLIQSNPLARAQGRAALTSIWLDGSLPARLSLGAEYLPVRDTVFWVLVRLCGAVPFPFRVLNLALYVGGVLLMRMALQRSVRKRWAAETAAWIFALHPAHVESVAWPSGLKDVLALVFVAAALWLHAGESRARAVVVPLLLCGAYFSKSLTVVAPLLLVAQDLLARRRWNGSIFAGAALTAILAFAVHLHVGHTVGMVAPALGGSRTAAALTMGNVWLRYFEELIWPGALSIVHDVPVQRTLSLGSALGWGILLVWGITGFVRWRRGFPLILVSWLWFVVPLAPVSQIVFPLQNAMADRYLLFSVLAPALLVIPLFERWPRVAIPGVMVALTGLAFATSNRSALFGDTVAVFADALRKTRTSPIPPYQIGKALEDSGDFAGAVNAYREVLHRRADSAEESRRATNNLARLYARAGRLSDAESVLRRGRRLWPEDEKVRENLRKVLVRAGRFDEAGALGEVAPGGRH